MIHVCVALVLHGESPHAIEVLAALKQQDLDEGTNLSLVVVDNVTPETVRAEIFESFGGGLLLLRNRENLGFSAAVNQCLAEALRYEAQYLLLLNPDVLLETIAVRELLRCATRHPEAAMISPKLLRANEDLSPTSPAQLDACGMKMTRQLRHFDRGSNELDSGQYQNEEEVFGGSGACLLINLSQISDLILPRSQYEKDLWKIYPQLEEDADSRPQLFDEAFFAYREDADLAWRAQIKSKKVFYCPGAVGHHIRKVTPEVRAILPAAINMWSTRNRFLMQINNLKPLSLLRVVIPGLLFRNLIVIAAVILKEKTSLPALRQVRDLFSRASFNRRFILKGLKPGQYPAIRKWFN